MTQMDKPKDLAVQDIDHGIKSLESDLKRLEDSTGLPGCPGHAGIVHASITNAKATILNLRIGEWLLYAAQQAHEAALEAKSVAERASYSAAAAAAAAAAARTPSTQSDSAPSWPMLVKAGGWQIVVFLAILTFWKLRGWM